MFTLFLGIIIGACLVLAVVFRKNVLDYIHRTEPSDVPPPPLKLEAQPEPEPKTADDLNFPVVREEPPAVTPKPRRKPRAKKPRSEKGEDTTVVFPDETKGETKKRKRK